MKRIIKFRVWDIKNKYFRKYTGEDHVDINEEFENPNYIFLQFTSLLDRNGKEIFEGDIVQKYYDIKDIPHTKKLPPFIVIWNQQHCGFSIAKGNNHFYEVIGNIYENPELKG